MDGTHLGALVGNLEAVSDSSCPLSTHPLWSKIFAPSLPTTCWGLTQMPYPSALALCCGEPRILEGLNITRESWNRGDQGPCRQKAQDFSRKPEAFAKWTNICSSAARKLEIKIDLCEMRLSWESRSTSHSHLSSGCHEEAKGSRICGPLSPPPRPPPRMMSVILQPPVPGSLLTMKMIPLVNFSLHHSSLFA